MTSADLPNLIPLQFPQYTTHCSHSEPPAGPQVKEALSQAGWFCTCSFLSLKWTLLPLPSTGPSCLNGDIQGCRAEIYRMLIRQEGPAQGATRGTGICLGSPCRLCVLVWTCICPEKGVPFSNFHKDSKRANCRQQVLQGASAHIPE